MALILYPTNRASQQSQALAPQDIATVSSTAQLPINSWRW